MLGRAVKIICINEDATNYWQKFSDFTFQMGSSSLFSFLWHCQWIGIGYPLALNGFLLWIISAFILRVNKSQLTTNKSSLNLSEWTIKTEGSEYLFFFLFLCSLNGACHWSPYGYARYFFYTCHLLYVWKRLENRLYCYGLAFIATSKSYVIWCQFLISPKNSYNHSKIQMQIHMHTNNNTLNKQQN